MFLHSIPDFHDIHKFPRLGQLIGKSPSLTIFPRYNTLDTQNLLYTQAEINELEKELQEICSEDRYSDDGEKQRFSVSGGDLPTQREVTRYSGRIVLKRDKQIKPLTSL